MSAPLESSDAAHASSSSVCVPCSLLVFTMSVRYFFLQDFTGDCISVKYQEAFQKRKGCDMVLYARGSSDQEERIYAHSEVLVHWSPRLCDIVNRTRAKRSISPENLLVATISCLDFSTIRLLMEMIYLGSAQVPAAAVSEFVEQGAKMQLKFREETAVLTPDMKEHKALWRRVGPAGVRVVSGDSAYVSLPHGQANRARIRKKRGRGISGRNQCRAGQQKRKASDGVSHDDDNDRGEARKRIRTKSEMENQIQLSPGSQVCADQASDLLDLSIVPTIDSD